MDSPDFIFWDVDPIVFQIGPMAPRWYGVLFASGFIIGYYIVRGMYRREDKPENDLDALLFYLIAATVIGARLGHVLFYDPAYYFSRPLEILKIWQGGLASHGGAIAIAVGLYLYARRHPDQPYLWLLDRIVVPTALAGSFIRLGNLFNSEILGVPTDVPWAFIFARVDLMPRHPAQLYESAGYLIIFIILMTTYRRLGEKTPRGLLLGLFLVLIFSWRVVVERFKMPQAAFAEQLPLSMGQILSIPLILVGLALLYSAWRQRSAASTRIS